MYIVFFVISIMAICILLILKINSKDFDYDTTMLATIGTSEEYTIGYSETITTTTQTYTTTSVPVTTMQEVSSVTTTTTTTSPLVEDSIANTNPSRATLPNGRSSQVADLKQSNPDTRGWIALTNTNISYAFTQQDNNDFYLDHDFDGNSSYAGWVFMDYRGTFDDNGQQSDVVTIYAHNMANGSMFSTLKRYRDNGDFYNANPIITVSSSNGVAYYKIFSYMVCNGLEGSDFEYWKFSDLSDPNDFYYFVNKAFSKSLIVTGVDLQYGDKIMALSTCNTGSTTNHDRFVVMARLVRDGEDLYSGCYRIR